MGQLSICNFSLFGPKSINYNFSSEKDKRFSGSGSFNGFVLSGQCYNLVMKDLKKISKELQTKIPDDVEYSCMKDGYQ